MTQDDNLPSSPAAERNKGPILEVLRARLPAQGRVLEIASGTGQHVVALAQAAPWLTWQPSDPEPGNVATIDARVAASGLTNIKPACRLDCRDRPWPVPAPVMLLAFNLIHIAPWPVAESLLAEAGAILPPGGQLVLYGPYRIGQAHAAESNAAFDAQLRERDAQWGIRDLETVIETAAESRLAHCETIAMPANNHVVIFRKPYP